MNNKIRISAIAAIDSKTRTIGGNGGGIPWEKISEDLRHFKKMTLGHPIIMGRVTWEELEGKPLPGRLNIIVTSNLEYNEGADDNNVFVVNCVEKAIQLAIDLETASENIHKEIFIIGGATIYEQALPFCDSLHLTLVDAGVDTPTRFPDYKAKGWTRIISDRFSGGNGQSYRFQTIEKRQA